MIGLTPKEQEKIANGCMTFLIIFFASIILIGIILGFYIGKAS